MHKSGARKTARQYISRLCYRTKGTSTVTYTAKHYCRRGVGGEVGGGGDGGIRHRLLLRPPNLRARIGERGVEMARPMGWYVCTPRWHCRANTNKSHRATPSCDACLPSFIIFTRMVETTLALNFRNDIVHTKGVSTAQFQLSAKTAPPELWSQYIFTNDQFRHIPSIHTIENIHVRSYVPEYQVECTGSFVLACWVQAVLSHGGVRAREAGAAWGRGLSSAGGRYTAGRHTPAQRPRRGRWKRQTRVVFLIVIFLDVSSIKSDVTNFSNNVIFITIKLLLL